MIIQTDFYGEVEYKKEDLITIPDGLFGFTELKYYLPLQLNPDDDSVIMLQSTEQTGVVFALINPNYLCSDYTPELTPEELSFLEVPESGELSFYVICITRDNYLENTVNLKCPIAINPKTRKGMQLILDDARYDYRHLLSSFNKISDNENLNDRGECDADSQTKKE